MYNIILYSSCQYGAYGRGKEGKTLLSSSHEHMAQEIECLFQRVFNGAVSGLISDVL